MFWKNLVSICNERGTTPTAVVNELGIAVGSVTRWKNGAVPRDTTLQKLADYFGVTVDDLLKNEPQKEEKAPTAEEEEADELNELLEELKTRPEMRILFSLAKGATKEDVELAVQIIERMRRNGGDGT